VAGRRLCLQPRLGLGGSGVRKRRRTKRALAGPARAGNSKDLHHAPSHMRVGIEHANPVEDNLRNAFRTNQRVR
jgi:hypothetical protein